jgi:hypothetical protein
MLCNISPCCFPLQVQISHVDCPECHFLLMPISRPPYMSRIHHTLLRKISINFQSCLFLDQRAYHHLKLITITAVSVLHTIALYTASRFCFQTKLFHVILYSNC